MGDPRGLLCTGCRSWKPFDHDHFPNLSYAVCWDCWIKTDYRPPKVAWWRALFLFLLCLFAALVIAGGVASADPSGGLFAEASTKVDGVTVRRVRDRDERIVCYVASTPPVFGRSFAAGHTAAISCLREATP